MARFVGSANILRGVAKKGPHGEWLFSSHGGEVPFLPGDKPVEENAPVTLAVRSEQIRFRKEGGGIPARVKEHSFTGGMLRIAFTLDGDGEEDEVVASRHGIDLDIAPGQQAVLSWEERAAVVVEEEKEG